MIRVGLAGYGLAGSAFHAPLIRACDRLELAAVLTSRDIPLRVDNFEQLLERSDLVVIATPNATHFELAAAALTAGKHVIVDKPFTVTVGEADELISMAKKRGAVLSVFHNRRWDSDFLSVQKVMPRLGEVMLFEAHWDRFRPGIKRGWREVPHEGAGLLNDLAPHMIDQALLLFGMPDCLFADFATQRPDARVEDYYDLTLYYGPKRVCLRSSTLVTKPRPRFALYGTNGSFVRNGLDPQESQLKAGADPRSDEFGIDEAQGILTLASGRAEPVPSERGDYPAFYEAIADAILDRAPAPVDPADARAGLMLIGLARLSAERGERLPVPAASRTAD